MSLREVIERRLRRKTSGVDVRGDVHAVVAANVNEPGGATSVSSKQTVVHRSRRTASTPAQGPSEGGTSEPDDGSTELSTEELERQEADELPNREAMSLINANVAAPVNAAAALNVLSDDSAAIANAEQTADIDQANE